MLITLIILFLFLSALFSGTEIAFVSANKLRIELRRKKGAARGAILADFYENPATFLSAMLVGNNIALVAFTTLMTTLLEPWLRDSIGLTHEFGLFITGTILITIVILIFGEFLPKTLFRLFSDDILYILAYPIRLLRQLLHPLAWVMIRMSNSLLGVFMRRPLKSPETAFTRLDLENFVRSTRIISGENTDEDAEVINTDLFGKALNLADMRVRQCMVPRTEVVGIDVVEDVIALENLFRESRFSRLLVYEEDINEVLGYVHHQQLLSLPPNIRDIVLPIPFVPEARQVTDLLNDFIKDRLSIACVVDEFGGVSGIVTMEDILEEIFGEIEDEHDEPDLLEVQLDKHIWRFSGRLEITYLNDKYESLDLPPGDYSTLSGYLVMTTGEIPKEGDVIEMTPYRFILENVSDTKIEMVRIERMPSEEDLSI